MEQYMHRRSHFLSDFERYNPVQNMQMLAHHVFELSEGVGRLKDDFTGSRRLLSIVAANQREENESIRAVGEDLGRVKENVSGVHSELKDEIGGLRGEIDQLRSEMHSIRQETQQGFAEIKQMLTMMVAVRG
jgi:seryl-tRNA synthetase